MTVLIHLRLASQALNSVPAASLKRLANSLQDFSATESICITLLNDFDVTHCDESIPQPILGTCQWIREHQTFVSWLENGSNALIWLTGHPGCGKSIISSALAKYFNEVDERPQTVLLSLPRNGNKQTDAKIVLRNLIFQMIGRHRSLISHVRKVYELHGQSMVQSFNHLWAVFLRLLQDPKSGLVYVILDALDEYEPDSCRQLLESISDMLSNSFYSAQRGIRVKFLITSRPFLYESYAAGPCLQSNIPIDEGQPGYLEDIQKFIRERVDTISQSRQFSTAIKEYLYQSMTLKADKTFLWIHMVLSSVEKSVLTAKSDLAEIIISIPKDLAATYQRYLASVSVDYQPTALRFLKLLLGSCRPLYLSELNVAFTMAPAHVTVDDISQELQNGIAHTIQGILGPLIRVSGTQVSFVHHSVKEFLFSEKFEDFTFPTLRAVTYQSSELCLATACIRYLLLQDFHADFFTAENSLRRPSESESESASELSTGGFWDSDSQTLDFNILYGELNQPYSDICDSISTSYEFYNYSALHWSEHFAASEDIAPGCLKNAAKKLLDASTGFCRNWLQFYRTKLPGLTDDDKFGNNAIVLASQFNMNTVLTDLLSTQNISQAVKDRSLYWAARLGHSNIAASLLHAGANPNAQELEMQTALTAASEIGNLGCIATLLADERTDINATGRGGRTAFSFACGGGFNDIISQLLQRPDCKDDQPDYSGSTPLFWAVGGGHPTTLSVLARRGSVNVNHGDKQGRTALSWAAGDGMADILSILLKIRGIKCNLADKKGKSPLVWAAGNGQTGTVEVLLKTARVDKSIVDKDRRSAISWASAGGHFDTLLKLLDAGCPGVDAEDIDGWTPLMWAIQTDSPETVAALIDSKQVQIHRRDRSNRTALAWAKEYRHTNVIDLLLRLGATDT